MLTKIGTGIIISILIKNVKFKIIQSTAHMAEMDVECSWSRYITSKQLGMFWNNFKVMYSDCEIFLWYETKVNIKECILKKWIKRSFLKNLPDNEDIKIFLIQEHFDKKWQIWIKN